jgi:hypothetical protein
MGTYTELVLKCRIEDDKPKIVHEILNFLFGDGSEMPIELPDHEFFKKKSWKEIGRSCSCYHIPCTLSFYDGKYLFTRSDMKNYEDEIECFINWLKPYLCNIPGQFIGWIFCEQSIEPFFIYNSNEDSMGSY